MQFIQFSIQSSWNVTKYRMAVTISSQTNTMVVNRIFNKRQVRKKYIFFGQSQPIFGNAINLKMRRIRTKLTQQHKVHCRRVSRRNICNLSWCLTMNVEVNALLINAIKRIVSCRENRVTTPESGSSFGLLPSKRNNALFSVMTISEKNFMVVTISVTFL